MGIVIDTSALIELERSEARESYPACHFRDSPVYVPTIVWAELSAGVHLADTPRRALKRRARLDRLRQNWEFLDFNTETAETWAELFATLQKAGTPIPSNDLIVAATALHYGHRILVSSKDESHFRQVPGLNVITLNNIR
ncbi:MAG TPA: type II toxin-antitoxin system VapC family toxin [Verrucomicrobiales bacterium]|jgi:predicted nucleic acid-binding protein|nr:type II toxin-antitoxin system VapC family toxin [Verrucomicrobiales bacterium]HIL69667.1 type II toxin-antitoxin system VapC family toxin [Verrucomicrobiota bacterium]